MTEFKKGYISYNKDERDKLVKEHNLIRHRTKKHLWMINGEFRWSNMNSYQAGVWFTDYSKSVNTFTDRWQQTSSGTIEQAIEKGAMPLAKVDYE